MNFLYDAVHVCMTIYAIQFARLGTMFTILWSVLMAAYWLVTGALLADLYRRYCNNKDNDCDDEERRFTVLTVMSFITAGGWVSVVHMYM